MLNNVIQRFNEKKKKKHAKQFVLFYFVNKKQYSIWCKIEINIQRKFDGHLQCILF